MITPPVGLNLFILKASVPGLTMKDVVLGSLPFISLLFMGLVLIMLFPGLATWLPGKMGFRLRPSLQIKSLNEWPCH